MLKKIRLGDDAQAYCGRCKEERLHHVVALRSDGQIERVTCNYCQSTHRYRDPQATGAATKTRRTTGARALEVRTRAASNQPARPYSPQETYAAGDNISHTKFGEGNVVAARQGKIDVRFGRGAHVCRRVTLMGRVARHTLTGHKRPEPVQFVNNSGIYRSSRTAARATSRSGFRVNGVARWLKAAASERCVSARSRP